MVSHVLSNSLHGLFRDHFSDLADNILLDLILEDAFYFLANHGSHFISIVIFLRHFVRLVVKVNP